MQSKASAVLACASVARKILKFYKYYIYMNLASHLLCTCYADRRLVTSLESLLVRSVNDKTGLACDHVAGSACAQRMQPAHTPASAHQASGLPQLKAIATVNPGMQELRQTERDVAAVRDMNAEEVSRSPGVKSVCQNFDYHRGVPDDRGCCACCSPPMTCLSQWHTTCVSSH